MLTFIFNQSLTTGEIPSDWLDANVSPLHKKGRRDLADNYRSISLTCIASKVLEHIIYSSIAGHLDKFSILSSLQHGFRSGHSCDTQLVIAVNDWAKAIDCRDRVDIAILDFSKAFDSVAHERLKSKLHSYGIRGNTLNWIASFLQNRRQRVLLNGVFSDWSKVQSGVPQGTVLGPLLFLIYINDICEGLSSNIRLFADDCLLYRTIKSSLDVGHFQDDLNRLGAWCRTWQMNFNVKKCSIMHLSRHRQPITDQYSLNGTVLSSVSSHPYLGIEIQNDLRWNNHINNIVRPSPWPSS